MSPALRNAAWVALGVVVAVALFAIWNARFSPEAEIERIHRACLAEIEAGKARMKSGLERGAGEGRPDDPARSIVKGLSESLGRMLDDVAGSMGDTVCGAVRDACREDFDGRICTAARERYP